MPRLPKLQYVKFTRAKGNVYGYFDTGRKDKNGKRKYAPLGKHSAVGFMDKYLAMMGHRTRRNHTPVTVSELADKYVESPQFERLSKGTRHFYTAQLKHVHEHLGKFPITAVRKPHIRELVGNRLHKNGTRNGVLAVYGVLHSFAVEEEILDTVSPTKGIPTFKMGEHKPWPETVLQAGLEADHDRTRLSIALLYYTGARIGDMVRFRWNNIRDGVLYFRTQKTGDDMEVTLHELLIAELERTPKRGLTIVVNQDGAPMTDQVIRRELKRFTADQGEEGLVPHGLRKNAVNALLEAGCTEYEVQAITGQSLKMIAHYARKVNKRKLGKAAILKFENKTSLFKPTYKQGRKPA